MTDEHSTDGMIDALLIAGIELHREAHEWHHHRHVADALRTLANEMSERANQLREKRATEGHP